MIDIIRFILYILRLIGYFLLVLMGIFGLNNYWSENTTSGHIACTISIFVIVYVVTKISEFFKKI